MKNLLKKIGQWIASLFNSITPKLKNVVHISASVTEAIKNFDTKNAYVADIITTLIPGDVDDKIKAKIRQELPKIVVELKLVDATLGLTDENEIMLSAMKTLNQLGDDYSSAFLHSIALLIAKCAADGELSWSDCVYVVQYFYDNEFKKAA